MKVMITGPSCSGKTTLINTLKGKGFKTVGEVARELIKKGLSTNSKILPWKDFYSFELEILNKQLSIVKSVNKSDLIFFDRGIHDTIGYLLYKGGKIPKAVLELPGMIKYHLVFYLRPLNNYSKDSERWEDEKTSRMLGSLIKKLYLDSGCEVIELPVFSDDKDENIKRRIKIILDKVNAKHL